jgi:hypothetical protein
MKKLLLLLLLLVGFQGYTQTVLSFYPSVESQMEWSQEEIIQILQKGEISFCKVDLIIEKDNMAFSVKNMEFVLKDPILESAYIESSVFYTKKGQRRIHCNYIIINGYNGQLEIAEEELKEYPILSKYLDKKIRKTRLKEYIEE